MCKRNGKPRYLSVCSGIEAASVAWEPLGWEPAAFSEIEPFPSAVLAHHWPDVPNLGDMTEHERWNIEPGSIDVLAGGTPCQAFSVAGLRKGLDDHRGGLTRTFVEIAGRLKPRWIVFENVPGLLSMHDNSFGNLLAALVGAGSALVPPRGLKWTAAGMVAGPERVAGWRTLDAQFFGVPQRRRRVFVVALAIPPGSGEAGGRAGIQCVEQVLFERESVRRDTQEGDETGQGPPGGAAQGSHWSGGPHPSLNQSHNTGGIGMSDQEVFAQRGAGLVPDVAGCLDRECGGNKLQVQYASSGHLVPVEQEQQADSCHCLRGEGFDASEDGTGRGTPIVPVAYRVHGENSTAMTGNGIANVADPADVSRSLDTCGGYATNQGGNVVVQPAYSMRSDAMREGVARTPSPDAEGRVRLRDPGMGVYEDVAPTIDCGTPHGVAHPSPQPNVVNMCGDKCGMSNTDDGTCYTVGTKEGRVVAFAKTHKPSSPDDPEGWKDVDTAPTLTNWPRDRGDNGTDVAIAFTQNQRDEVRDLGDLAGTVGGHGTHQTNYVAMPQPEEPQAFYSNESRCDNIPPPLKIGSGGTCGNPPAIAFEPRMVRTTGGQPQADICHCLRADTNTGDGAPCVCFTSKDHGGDATDGTAPTLRSMPHDTSHANGGGQLAVAMAIQGAATRENPSSGPDGAGVRADDTAYTLEARQEVQAVAFQTSQPGTRTADTNATLDANNGVLVGVEAAPFANKGFFGTRGGTDTADPLRAKGGDTGNGGECLAVVACDVADTLSVGANQTTGRPGDIAAVSIAPSLTAGNDPSRSPQSSEVTQQVEAVHAATMVVRRLTPVECERLQGFPDGHTMIPWRGKPAGQCPDGPRYKAIGNSMAVPCMRWLGERIDAVMRGEDGP